MHRATSLDREIVLTQASMLIAAARHRGTSLDPHVVAREILAAHPEVHVTEPGLTQVIMDMLLGREPSVTPAVVAAGAMENEDLGSRNLSCGGTDRTQTGVTPAGNVSPRRNGLSCLDALNPIG